MSDYQGYADGEARKPAAEVRTAGVFEVLAGDEATSRTASRKALVLAEGRVDALFGQWLKQASTAEGFDTVFALIKPDFESIVAQACEDVGHDNPTAVSNTLYAHLRPVAPSPRTAAVVHEARKPKMCPYHSEVVDISLASDDPRAGYDTMASHAWSANHCQGGEYAGAKCNFKREMVTKSYWEDKEKDREKRAEERQEQAEQQMEQMDVTTDEVDNADTDSFDTPVDTIDTDLSVEPVSDAPDVGMGDFADSTAISEPSMALAASIKDVQYLDDGGRFLVDSDTEAGHRQASNPADQKDTSAKKVPCPQCGGSGKTSNNKECSKCQGKGQVSDWGGSALDALESKTAGDGPTGLGAPSPKMDKSEWTPQNPKKFDEESKYNPTVEKDPIEPIIPKNREEEGEEPKEIGEKTTEKVDLKDTGSETGFADGGQTKGEGTKTWPKGTHEVDPVTSGSRPPLVKAAEGGGPSMPPASPPPVPSGQAPMPYNPMANEGLVDTLHPAAKYTYDRAVQQGANPQDAIQQAQQMQGEIIKRETEGQNMNNMQQPVPIMGSTSGEYEETWPHMDDMSYEAPPGCPTCGGPGNHLGRLGQRDHYRCQNCGKDYSLLAQPDEEHYAKADDINKNPIVDIMENDFDGFVPAATVNTVTAALSE